MNTKGSVIAFFGCFVTLFTLTDCNKCDTNLLEGSSHKFQLADRPVKDSDKFTIIKDNIVFASQKNKNQLGPGLVKNTFLELKHVEMNYSGLYMVQTFDNKGQNLKSYKEIVCVYAKVPKPTVNVTCLEKFTLRCEVEGVKELSFTWQNNGKELKQYKENVLTNVNPDDSVYTCTAANLVHSAKSDPVFASCSEKLFGFDRWIMISILAGGGALVLFFTIVLVSVGCRSCKRRKKHQADEEELRLNYLNAAQFPPKSKQTARGQPAPQEPVDNGSAQDVEQTPCQTAPRTRNQQRARPPPPPIDDDEEQPPPLPQPRKKAQVKNHDSSKTRTSSFE